MRSVLWTCVKHWAAIFPSLENLLRLLGLLKNIWTKKWNVFLNLNFSDLSSSKGDWISIAGVQTGSQKTYFLCSFLNELDWKGQCETEKQFWILSNSKVRCSVSVSRAHETFCCSVLIDKDRVAACLESFSCPCNLHPYCSQAAEEISPKEAELSILPLLLPFFFFFLNYILGHSMALHWPERQRVLSYSGFSHSQCAGPLLGLALAFSLSPPPVSLFILCSSNSIVFRILSPYLKTVAKENAISLNEKCKEKQS